MRKSTRLLLIAGLGLSALVIPVIFGLLGLAILVIDTLGVGDSPLLYVAAGAVVLGGVTGAILAYARRTAHRSWSVNTSRYPGVKAAIDRYRDRGEGVRRVLPAFLMNGRRYFLVKYVRRNEEWAPEGETGMVVLDDQGRVQSDEDLLRQLLKRVRYVEDAFQGLRGQEDVIAAGPRMQREITKAQSFFANSVFSGADPEWLKALEEFWQPLKGHVQRIASLLKGEYDWSNKHRTRVEFTLEEMKPLMVAREEASTWLAENATRIGQAWATVEKNRTKLENLPGLSSGQRATLRGLMQGFQAAAEATSDPDDFKIHVSSRRLGVYRARTAKALQLEGEAQHSANGV